VAYEPTCQGNNGSRLQQSKEMTRAFVNFLFSLPFGPAKQMAPEATDVLKAHFFLHIQETKRRHFVFGFKNPMGSHEIPLLFL
jgi:hypothetical protein